MFLSDIKNQRILILRGGALGDFILTLPAISALRRRWPKAYIELAGYEKSACLVLATGLVDRLQSLDSARMALYFQGECALPPEEKKYIRSFDLIVSYLHDPEGVLLKHLKDAGAENIIAVSPLEIKNHAADHFLSGLKDILGDEAREYPPVRLEWLESLRQEAHRRLSVKVGEKKIIIIHPGSGSPAKNWPAKNFAMLAKKIRGETEFEPIIIGGEADEKTIAVMRPLLPEFRFLVNAPLTDVASILSAAGGFVGNDSGITHLAAALGIPVIALFGPTDPAIWAPRGKNIAIIKSLLPSNESLAAIGVNAVLQALIKALVDN